MLIPVRDTGRIKSSLLLLIAAASTLLLPAYDRTSAQAAPQLLPYTVTAIAGGAISNPAKGTTCPISGLTSLDAFGDGCLATEVKLSAPRFVTEDKLGNVFFSDSGNALVRRIDAATGVISVVAGGATSNPRDQVLPVSGFRFWLGPVMPIPVTVGGLIVQTGVAAVQPGRPMAPGKVLGTDRLVATPLATPAVR